MAVTVENLEKLERRMTLTLPVTTIQSEIEARLKRLARTVKMDGFRPGKVPLNVVAQRYGYSVHHDVLNDKVGEAFSTAANEARLRIAGQPRITERQGAAEGEMAFDAVFEVFPEVKLGDLAAAQVEKLSCPVEESAIDKTLDILRKQRRTFTQRPADAAAESGDRITVDFEGTIDGEPFEGGKADGFQFILGDGQMLKEFEEAATGMKVGERKTFQLAFPADYHGKDVAGKMADFMVSVHKIEASHLPEVNEALAKSLGVESATVEGLRADIRRNLEREVQARLLSRNKQAALDAVAALAELDLPKASVQLEVQRLTENARADLKQRGYKDADKAPIPEEVVLPQAERRVRLGLVVAELVRAHSLQARPEQIKAHVDELAASYEKPAEVVRWYYGDTKRMSEVEAVVIEKNVTEFIQSKAGISERQVAFDELMGQG